MSSATSVYVQQHTHQRRQRRALIDEGSGYTSSRTEDAEDAEDCVTEYDDFPRSFLLSYRSVIFPSFSGLPTNLRSYL
jgi:hypothetical protein